MPTQMPRNGVPRFSTLSSSAAIMPGIDDTPRMQSANAPTPGSTMRSADFHLCRVRGDDDLVSGRFLRRHARKRLLGGTQIPRAVIDKGDSLNHAGRLS